MYWKAAIRSLETKGAHGVHERRYAAGDSDASNRISHAPIISTNHLIKITIQLLENYGFKQGVELKVSSNSWVGLKCMPNNGQQQTSKQYTGKIPFLRALQTRELCNDHPHNHYNADMKQI